MFFVALVLFSVLNFVCHYSLSVSCIKDNYDDDDLLTTLHNGIESRTIWRVQVSLKCQAAQCAICYRPCVHHVDGSVKNGWS